MNLPFSTPLADRQRGISLVEIMVSLVAGLILTAGVYEIYISNKQTYRVNEAMAAIQENARFALELMSRDIRMAGYVGCYDEVPITNTLDYSNTTQDFLLDFDTPIEGFEAVSNTAWDRTLDANIVTPSGNAPEGGTDVLVIRRADEISTPITGQPNNRGDCSKAAQHTADLKVASTAGLSAGDIVFATNCSHASIFQITNINTGNNLVHQTGSHIPGNHTTDLGACYAGTGELTKISSRIYFVGRTPDNRLALYRREGLNPAEVLVDGVTDFQVLYGLDTDGDGSVNLEVPANYDGNGDGSPDYAWDKVVSIRVSLTLASRDNVSVISANPISKDFVTVVGIRNRLP